ncbi:arginase family protein, partial [Bacillus sp. SS-TM]
MKKEISVIGVPMDLGQMRRGVDMGPSAIRYAGVIERIEEIGYDVKECRVKNYDRKNGTEKCNAFRRNDALKSRFIYRFGNDVTAYCIHRNAFGSTSSSGTHSFTSIS